MVSTHISPVFLPLKCPVILYRCMCAVVRCEYAMQSTVLHLHYIGKLFFGCYCIFVGHCESFYRQIASYGMGVCDHRVGR